LTEGLGKRKRNFSIPEDRARIEERGRGGGHEGGGGPAERSKSEIRSPLEGAENRKKGHEIRLGRRGGNAYSTLEKAKSSGKGNFRSIAEKVITKERPENDEIRMGS